MKRTDLGKYMREVREQRGYSIRGLAALAKVDASWLSKVERGVYPTPDARYLYRLARSLDIETADLYLEAGYGDARGLPGFAPYLRAKYHLPKEAVAELEAQLERINDKYQPDGEEAA